MYKTVDKCKTYCMPACMPIFILIYKPKQKCRSVKLPVCHRRPPTHKRGGRRWHTFWCQKDFFTRKGTFWQYVYIRIYPLPRCQKVLALFHKGFLTFQKTFWRSVTAKKFSLILQRFLTLFGKKGGTFWQ